MAKSGLLVIDEDRPDAFAKYAADHGVEIPPTFTVKTGKGRHYYFRDTENGALSNHEGALQDYGINVRSGNAYVVGPGSKHKTGSTTEWSTTGPLRCRDGLSKLSKLKATAQQPRHPQSFRQPPRARHAA